MRQLEHLGFSTADCQQALVHADGDLDGAALWLTDHAKHSALPVADGSDSAIKSNGWGVSGLEVSLFCDVYLPHNDLIGSVKVVLLCAYYCL